MSLEDYDVIFTCLCCGFETKKEAEVKQHEVEAKHANQRWMVEAPGCGTRAQGSPYSNQVLESKAKHFAECLLELVTRMGPTFYKAVLDDAPVKEETLWAIQLELVFLCLFLTSVVVFVSHDAEKRKVFMDALGYRVRDLLIKELHQEDAAEAFHIGFFKSSNLRQVKYLEYRELIPAEGESGEDTLFWEFGKRMSALHGNNNPMRAMQVSDAAFGLYEPIVRVLRILKVIPPPEGDAFYDSLSDEAETRFRKGPLDHS